MYFPNVLKDPLLTAIDAAMAVVPRPRPPKEAFEKCRVVAHRGAHDVDVENTLPAFLRAVELGAWGIEFDIRWTKCGRPIVHHDAHFQRLFGDSVRLKDLDFNELRRRIPAVPTLDEVVAAVGGRAHLMIEVKGRASKIGAREWASLKEALGGSEPVRDHHLMSLDPDVLRNCPIAPNEALLPIAEFNIGVMTRLSVRKGLGGVTGQYLMISDRLIRRLHDRTQRVGTGFVCSRSVLYRELNRGADWLFSDTAADLLKIIQDEKNTP